MEISSGSYNQPVNFYPKNTGNNIGMYVENENNPYTNNFYTEGNNIREMAKTSSLPNKKRRRNRRLNTVDSDYFPDEAIEEQKENETNNFFIAEKSNPSIINIKRAYNYFVENTPLINYFFLKKKKQKIQKTVEELNNINQNVDEIMNSAIPYGESTTAYNEITNNLINAAGIIGKINKDF